jgi:hypothetical protein
MPGEFVYSEGKVRPLLALLLPLALAGFVSAQSRVIAVSMDKVIHPITVEILTHAIDQARREQGQLRWKLRSQGSRIRRHSRGSLRKIDREKEPL